MRVWSVVLALVALFGLALPGAAGEVVAVRSGDWENPATWGLEGRCPQFFDSVVIPVDVTVTVNAPFPVPPEVQAQPGCSTLDINVGSLVVEGTLVSAGGTKERPNGRDIVIIASGRPVGDLGPGQAGADDIVVSGTIRSGGAAPGGDRGGHIALVALQGNVAVTGSVEPAEGGRLFVSGANRPPAAAGPVDNPKVFPVAQMPSGDLLLTQVEERGGPPYGGSYSWSTFSNPRTLNYVVAREASSSEISNQMIRPILGPAESEALIADTVEPELAEAYWFSEDGRSLFVRFRKGLTWSDGVAFDVARDVVEAYRRIHLDEVFAELELSRFQESCSAGGRPPVVSQVDERTVRFTWAVKPTGLEDPGASPFICFTFEEFGPIPMHRLGPEVLTGDRSPPSQVYSEAFAKAWGATAPPCPVGEERVEDPAQAPAAGEPCVVSIGPFILSAPVKLDVGASFRRNPWFYGVDDLGHRLPYLETLNQVVVENQDVELLKFLNGETDVLSPRSIDVAVIQGRAAQLNIRLTTATSVSGLGASFQGFNQENPVRPGLSLVFRVPEFRRAMSNLTDRGTMVASLNAGFGQAHFQPGVSTQFMLSNEDPEFKPLVEVLRFDPDRAAKRLDNLGLVDRDEDGVRDIPVGWGYIVPGDDDELQSAAAGDDFDEDGIIYPGPNGILDTEAAGDDIALVTEEPERLEFSLTSVEGSTFWERAIVLFAETAQEVGLKVQPELRTFTSLVRALLTPESDAWESVVIAITGDWRGPGVLDSCGSLHLGDLVASCDAVEGITDDIRIPFQKVLDAEAPRFQEAEDPAGRAERSRRWQLTAADSAYLVYHIKGLGHGAVREDRVANTGAFPIDAFGPNRLEIVFRVDL